MRTSRLSAIGLGFAIMLGLSCNHEVPVTASMHGISGVIARAGDFEQVAFQVQVDSTQKKELRGQDTLFCTTKTYKTSEGFEDFPIYDTKAALIFPGNLLQGKSLGTPNPEQITVKRAGGRIVVVLFNGSQRVSRHVPEVTLDEVVSAENQILAEIDTTLPANFIFNYTQVNSKSEMGRFLKINASAFFGDLDAQLSFSSEREYNRYLVSLTQVYYTMAYVPPTSYTEVFAPEVTPEQLSRYMGPGNPAAYIVSVTYGRVFHMLIESTESKQAMDASLNATFKAGLTNGTLNGSTKYINDLDDRKIKVFALGGDANKALASVFGGFEALKNFLQDGGNFKTGVPLSYDVWSLNSHQRVANKVTSEYSVKDCVPSTQSDVKPLFWYRADSLITPENGQGITKWGNSFKQGKNDAVALRTSESESYPLRVNGLINGKPAIVLQAKYKTPNGNPDPNQFFEFDGGVLAGTDYTLFLLVALKPPSDYYDNYFSFIYGNSTERRHFLNIGYLTKDTFAIGYDTLQTPEAQLWATVAHLKQFHLYTIRFSSTEGMSLYVDGVLRRNKPSLFEPLLFYRLARIGISVNPSDKEFPNDAVIELKIAEIKAYSGAMSETLRKAEEVALMNKYNLPKRRLP